MKFFENVLRWPWSWCRITSFVILTVVLVIYSMIQMTYFNSYLHIKFLKSSNPDTDGKYGKFNDKVEFKGEKLIHFDLKGAPPKISYLLKILPLLKKLGATGVLMEYEDMFPYHSGLEEIAALNAYTLSDIAAIVETARLNNLSIVPLIPTFDHFEFVLKHLRHRELREIEENPQALCPSHERVHVLLQKMIDQVLNAHNISKYLHIGCDEVEFLGVCPRCQKQMRKNKWPKDGIYFNHVRKIAEYIASVHPGVKPIVWCDKFLKHNEKIIIKNRIPDLVDVMFWENTPKYVFPSTEDMESMARLFKDVWIANAFKGATGYLNIVTDTDYYLIKSIKWTEFVEKWKAKLNFKGIAVTGRQRYNHFMGLCELFPVGIPSLALNLHTLTHGAGLEEEAIKNSLNCNELVPVTLREIQDSALLSRLKCNFPGFKIYRIIHSYYITLTQLKTSLKKNDGGHLTFYGILHNASNPTFIQQVKKAQYQRHLIVLDDLKNKIKIALAEVYDQFTINEWITTHVLPLRLHLEATVNMINALSGARIWPRRPLENVEVLVNETFNKICSSNEVTGCSFFNIHI